MTLANASWKDILAAPVFVINMDACADRMKITEERIRAAGYTDVRRMPAIDARTCDLKKEWEKYGNPAFAAWDQEELDKFPGKQCCILSWLKTLEHIANENIPYATVFEDDVMFHKDYEKLAPAFYEATPKDFHMCYLGSQIDYADRVPEISHQCRRL
jgi:GR25 family glycosyltransferase involved in LPS biosynthesis